MIKLLVFPVAAVALTFLVVMPFLSLLSWLYLKWHRSNCSWQSYATASTYTAIVAPTILSLCWLSSAAAHESESLRFMENCQVDHPSMHCVDALMIFLIILALFMWGIFKRFGYIYAKHTVSTLDPLPESSEISTRLRHLTRSVPSLSGVKITVVDNAPFAAMTYGVVPRIYITKAFLDQNDDEVVLATLLHEASHVRGRDPLRYILADLLLQLNPFGWLLRREFWFWQDAREARCDHLAVCEGADAMALAHGVVKAIKFEQKASRGYGVNLSGYTRQHIKLRIALLMEGQNIRDSRRSTLSVLFFLILLVSFLLLPHQWTAFSLLSVHHFVENTLIP